MSNFNFLGAEVKIFVQNPSNAGFKQPEWHRVATHRTVWTSFNGLSHYRNILGCTYRFYTTTFLLYCRTSSLEVSNPGLDGMGWWNSTIAPLQLKLFKVGSKMAIAASTLVLQNRPSHWRTLYYRNCEISRM